MELDADDIFKDDEDHTEAEASVLVNYFLFSFFPFFMFCCVLFKCQLRRNPFYQEDESSKEYVVYLVDASPKMFKTYCSEVTFLSIHLFRLILSLSCLWETDYPWLPQQEDYELESHFHIAISCIYQALKTQIISNSYDQVAICFFNTVSVCSSLLASCTKLGLILTCGTNYKLEV